MAYTISYCVVKYIKTNQIIASTSALPSSPSFMSCRGIGTRSVRLLLCSKPSGEGYLILGCLMSLFLCSVDQGEVKHALGCCARSNRIVPRDKTRVQRCGCEVLVLLDVLTSLAGLVLGALSFCLGLLASEPGHVWSAKCQGLGEILSIQVLFKSLSGVSDNQ